MSTYKARLSNALLVLVLVMGAALFLGCRMLESRAKVLATANETIAALQAANNQQASQLATLTRDETVLRKLLDTQHAALAALDNQHRKTTDELQQALATPPTGRPDCGREPLSGAALRLLKPSPDRGANAGHQAVTTTGAGAPLPGA